MKIYAHFLGNLIDLTNWCISDSMPQPVIYIPLNKILVTTTSGDEKPSMETITKKLVFCLVDRGRDNAFYKFSGYED